MSIIQATGEGAGFTGFPTLPLASTTAGVFRPVYARCATYCPAVTSVTDPPVSRLQLPAFTPVTSVWLHFNFYVISTANVTNNQWVIFRSPDGFARVLIRASASVTGNEKVSTRNAAGTFTDIATFSSAFGSNSLYTLDMHVDYSGPAGGVNVWLNGSQVVNYTGNLRTDSATSLNQIELCNAGTGVGGFTYFSEIIVADQDTRGMSLWTIPPMADGNTQTWVPDDVTQINEIATNDSTFISTTAADALSQWTPNGPTAPTGVWTVLAFVQEARTQVGATGPQHMEWNVRTTLTDFNTLTLIPLSTSFNAYQNVWPFNPSTGGAWAITDFTDPTFGYGIISRT